MGTEPKAGKRAGREETDRNNYSENTQAAEKSRGQNAGTLPPPLLENQEASEKPAEGPKSRSQSSHPDVPVCKWKEGLWGHTDIYAYFAHTSIKCSDLIFRPTPPPPGRVQPANEKEGDWTPPHTIWSTGSDSCQPESRGGGRKTLQSGCDTLQALWGHQCMTEQSKTSLQSHHSN